MRIQITDIYRIDTMNSTYEIKVCTHEGDVVSTCKKMGPGESPKWVQSKGVAYLEQLFIGASFKVPGVVTTSIVQDYQHMVVSPEPKRHYEVPTTIPGFFQGLTDHIIGEVNGNVRAMVVNPGPRVDLDDFDLTYELADIDPRSAEYAEAGKPDRFLQEMRAANAKARANDRVEGCPDCAPGSGNPAWHNGSRVCKSGSIASGGTRAHCTCDYCY